MLRRTRRQTPGRQSRAGRGFTLIELLVVIAIISLLVSILLPSLSKAKELAKNVACMSQMRSIGLGVEQYLQDNSRHYPALYYDIWYLLGEYLNCTYPAGVMHDDSGILVCPSDEDPPIYNAGVPSKAEVRIDYGFNYTALSTGLATSGPYNNAAKLKQPARIPMFSDAIRSLINPYNPPDGPNAVEARHNDFANVLFCDYSIRPYTFGEMTYFLADIPTNWK